MWVGSTVEEDHIDFDDGVVSLTIECSDGFNPPITESFLIDIQDVVIFISHNSR